MSLLPELPPMPVNKTKEVKTNTDESLLVSIPHFVRTELSKAYYVEMYNKIKENGTPMQKVDSIALGRLACNLAIVDTCTQDIEEKGIHMEVQGDRNVVTKRNPSIDLLTKAESTVKAYLKEFKMTPHSRGSQLSTTPVGEQSDGFDEV